MRSVTHSPNGRHIGIGLEFQEVNQLGEAEVRIGYSTADGSSASAVGREVFDVPLERADDGVWLEPYHALRPWHRAP